MHEGTGDLLMATARSLRRRFGTALAEWDVTPAQSRALRIIGHEGAVRPSGLADRLHIAPRSATEVVDALVERGLAERAADPDDRRATLVRATRAGERMLVRMDRVRAEQTEQFLAVLSERDRATLDRLLVRLAEQETGGGRR